MHTTEELEKQIRDRYKTRTRVAALACSAGIALGVGVGEIDNSGHQTLAGLAFLGSAAAAATIGAAGHRRGHNESRELVRSFADSTAQPVPTNPWRHPEADARFPVWAGIFGTVTGVFIDSQYATHGNSLSTYVSAGVLSVIAATLVSATGLEGSSSQENRIQEIAVITQNSNRAPGPDTNPQG